MSPPLWQMGEGSLAHNRMKSWNGWYWWLAVPRVMRSNRSTAPPVDHTTTDLEQIRENLITANRGADGAAQIRQEKGQENP